MRLKRWRKTWTFKSVYFCSFKMYSWIICTCKNNFQKRIYVLKEKHMQRNFFPLEFGARETLPSKRNLFICVFISNDNNSWCFPLNSAFQEIQNQNWCSHRTAVLACEVSILSIASFHRSHFQFLGLFYQTYFICDLGYKLLHMF